MVKTVVVVCEVAEVQGGAEKVAIESSLALADSGLNVIFFAASGPTDPRLSAHPNIEVKLVREQYVVDELPERERILRATYDRVSQSAFDNLLKQLDPEHTVVHMHAWRFALTSSILKPLFDSSVAVVYTLHEFGIGCPYVGFYDYRRNAICPQRGGSLGCMMTNCNRTSFKHKTWIFYKNGVIPNWLGQRRHFRHCIFVSEFSRQILRDYVAPEAKQYLVRNPIEIPKRPAREFSAGGAFLFVGRMTLEKDPLTLARAAKMRGLPVE
ncbi:MAG TPA: glycosyltransferase, partial [Fimbriimonadaceae bacterium]|nr:glycosyltransferase [Fimbriimonadaceae bacterium]